MNQIFAGEHLLPGQIGQSFVVLSFVGAILATISYYAAHHYSKNQILESKRWLSMARVAFLTHFVSVIGIATTLFYIIHSHYFEYHYAWSHSSRS